MARFLCDALEGTDRKMGHALGMDNRKSYKHRGQEFYLPYRNYYSANIDQEKGWEKAVENGLAEKYVNEERQYTNYHVTRAGMDYLGKKLGVYVFNVEK